MSFMSISLVFLETGLCSLSEVALLSSKESLGDALAHNC
jgi:hypothetical protein